MKTLLCIIIIITCLAFVSYSQNQPPAAPAKQPPVADTDILNQIRNWAKPGAQDVNTQSNNLISSLKQNGMGFAWTPDECISLQKNAAANASELTSMENLLQQAGLINQSGNVVGVFLFAGAKLENPYSININTNNTGTLKQGNSTSDGFVEFDLFARYIFRTGSFDDHYYLREPQKIEWITPVPFLGRAPDFDLKMGYTFAGTSAPTNFTASTIAQGSDFYLNGSFGTPVLRYNSGTGFKLQGTLELAGGFTTDKNFLNIHPELFGGAGLQMARLTLGSPTDSTFGDLYWLVRAGYGVVDQPHLTTGRTVALDGLGDPIFDWKGAPTVGTTLILKLSQAFAAEFAGNVYFTRVASWNLSVGISVDPSKFFPIGK